MAKLLLGLFLAALASVVHAETLRLNASRLFERSITESVVLTDGDAAIELAAGELIEDDGPAAGYSYKPTTEKLSGDICIKKEFVLDRAASRGATLLVARGGELKLAVNGNEAALGEPRMAGHHWQAYRIDPAALQSGTNEFVLRGSGEVWVALDEDYAAGSITRTRHPNRSAKSRDDGKTWDYDHLGAKDDLDGEYNVRLFLDRYLPQGRITSCVLDLGNLGEQPFGKAGAKCDVASVALDVELSRGARLDVRYRSGSTFVPGDKSWTNWQAADERSFEFTPGGRYFQFEIALHSDDPLVSPKLRGATITAEAAASSDWSGKLRVVKSDNPPVIRSSIPFAYEPFDQPALAKLRADNKLDEVVRGAKTEFELITRLAAWSSQRWPKIAHLAEAYPPWDARAILATHRDGTTVGGFCLQYNLVFLQACESFGIPGRVLSIGAGNHVDKIRGGHEVVELWSNDFRKWIYVDGNTAWYFVDDKTGSETGLEPAESGTGLKPVPPGVPLSLWELRERQLDVWAERETPPVRCVKLAETRFEWNDLHGWPPLVELRLVPRSDFLARKAPLPLNQGMRGWFWTGHYVWTDDRIPAREVYSQRVTQRRNWEWTLNRAHIALEPTTMPGELRVHLDGDTPGLETYLVSTDAGRRTPAGAVFTWKLHSGANRLSVVPRNIAGREGIESWIEVNYEP